MDSRQLVPRGAGDLIPYGGFNPSPRAMDPLEEKVEERLSAEGIKDPSLSTKIVEVFREMRGKAPSDDLPKPIGITSDYKAIIVHGTNTVEFYLYPKKNKRTDLAQPVQIGMTKVMNKATALAISRFDQELVPKDPSKEIRRFSLDLTDKPTYANREEAFKHEVSLLEKVKDNPKFTKLLAHTIYDGSKGKKTYRKGMMFQEYYPNGNLADKIKEIGPLKGDKKARLEQNLPLFRTILEALVALDNEEIIHSDLNPTNILFDSHLNAVIADLEFALSSEEFDNKTAIKKYLCRGTPEFMSPEKTLIALKGQYLENAHLSANVWSIGCILHFLYHGSWPEALRLLGEFAIENEQFETNRTTMSAIEIRAQKTALETKVRRIRQLYQTMETAAARAQDDLSMDYMIQMMLHPNPHDRFTSHEALHYFEAITPT